MTENALFQDRTAIVTGGASGIGRAVVDTLCELGARVYAVDRDPSVRSVIPRAIPVVLDVTDAAACDELLAEVDVVDCLVNAAGVIRAAPLEAVTSDDWDMVFDVNAKALFFLTQLLLPRIPAGGAIVNVASTAGKTGATTEIAPYSASKAAVIALTKTFAYELAPRRVRVNCVCPGNVATPMHDAVVSALAGSRDLSEAGIEESYNRAIPLGRAAETREVAELVAFLLSDRASYMTGQALNVSGGLVMY